MPVDGAVNVNSIARMAGCGGDVVGLLVLSWRSNGANEIDFGIHAGVVGGHVSVDNETDEKKNWPVVVLSSVMVVDGYDVVNWS